MPGELNEDNPSQPLRVEVVDDNPTERHNGHQSPGMTNSKGWDGKLRVPGRVSLANPEALSDPDYSDEENIVRGEEIVADEGEQFPDHGTQSLPFPTTVNGSMAYRGYQISSMTRTQIQTS